MNNAQLNCPKCVKMFANQLQLAKHARGCQKVEVKMDTSEKEEVKSEGFKLEVKDPLGDNIEISISPSIENVENEEPVNWDKTEKETKELLKGYKDFMKNNDEMFVDLDAKVQESEKKVLEKSSLSSIVISDDDDDDCIPRMPSLPPGKRNLPQAEYFKVPKPPQPILPKFMPRPKPMPPIVPKSSLVNRAGAGLMRADPLACVYCSQLAVSRVSLAKHLIAAHWDQVRERQGGGRRDNSAYYASIEDSRIIKPEPKFKLPRTQPSQVRSLANVGPSITPKWLNKLENGTRENVNKKARNSHNPSWYGAPPNRKIAPKSIPFEATFDLTKEDPDACSVCDDDFNWPDEKHVCKRTLKKDPSKLNSRNHKKVLQPVTVSSNRNSSKTAPIRAPIKNGGKDLKNLVKKLSTNSQALQITPVMKK